MAETVSRTDDDRTYGGLFGAYPYAFRRSDSRLCRVYVVVGGLAAVTVAFLFVLALVYLIGGSFGAQAGVFTFSRSFYVVVALLVVSPLIAPVLLVARHHRRAGNDSDYDRALAGSGFGYLLTLFLATTTTVPPENRDPAETYGALEPAVRTLYGLPPVAGLGMLLAAAALMVALHRRRR